VLGRSGFQRLQALVSGGRLSIGHVIVTRDTVPSGAGGAARPVLRFERAPPRRAVSFSPHPR
jgi:hypothetical protein